ncbi:MAG: class I SAM-dependent rRNA methyltransferase [Gemmataceae bacterium]|nr:class I SAM-dependent rRNA methyltransferase [Gemmataceae bacterium]
MPPLPRVLLRPRRAQPFFSRHPWVYTGAIQEVDGTPADGDPVDVVTHTGTFIARGFFNSRSKIRARLYSWKQDQDLNADFFKKRFAAATRFRAALFGLGDRVGYRLLASEADSVSGLIVDRYDKWLTVQFTSLALGQRREWLIPLLAEVTGCKGIYLRTEKGIGQLEGLELRDGPVWGEPPDGPVFIDDGVVRYRVDLREGQKTGFFLDQRANRLAVANYTSGRTVLDCFCYSGGFGLHAAKKGAISVEAVDISESALNLARENADLNGVRQIRFVKADIFDHLNALVRDGRKFGAVILDPPKFARTRKSLPDALRGYHSLLSNAVRLLEPDGVLVMCCCSGLISMSDIETVLARVAVDAGRDVQILERRGQDVDHPISVTCLETGYLKCLVCRVI